uniref:Tumor protein 63like [Saccoglossus kowalevskii] n=1 Tax=Lepeophtheirus salmonis TaxID=72036 RepID=A0A0K2TT30_LEPSM
MLNESGPPHQPLLVPEKDFNKMMSDLQSRLPSSDGEFSEIAKKEFENMSKDQLDIIRDLVNTESEGINLEDPEDVQKLRYSSSNSSTGSNPPLTDWSGNHGFKLVVSDSKKKRNATYEPALNKLYVQQNKAVTINISYNANSFVERNIQIFDGSLQVRAVAVFTEPEWHSHPVNVCYEHSRNSVKELKNPLAEHLIRCISSESTYHVDSS